MTATLGSFPVFRALDAGGAPLVGGLLYSYGAGTLVPLATYVDQAGVTTNANPVVLDSTGSANVWFGSSAYKLVLKDSTGSTLWTVDNYQPESAAATLRSDLASTASTALGDGLVGVKSTATGAGPITQHSRNQQTISVTDFYANGSSGVLVDPTGVVDSTLGIQAAINYASYMSTGNFPVAQPVKVHFPSGDYKITSGLTANRRVWLCGDGCWATRLVCTTAGATFFGLSLRPDGSAAVPIFGAIIENLQIVGNGGATTCSGISTGSTAPYAISKSVFQNLVMYDVATGILAGDGADNSFYNNQFRNITITGSTGGPGVTAYGLRINSAVYNTFEGIEVTSVRNSAYAFYLLGGWNTFRQLACDGVSYMDIPNSSLEDFTVEGIYATTPVTGLASTALNINRCSILSNITLIDCPNAKVNYGLTTLGNGIVIDGLCITDSGGGKPNYVFAPGNGTYGSFQGFTSNVSLVFRVEQYTNADTMSRWHFSACLALTWKDTVYKDAGSATFVAATTVAVTLTKAQPDTNYFIGLAPQANKTFWVTAKAVGGFTLNASSSSSDVVDWVVTR